MIFEKIEIFNFDFKSIPEVPGAISKPPWASQEATEFFNCPPKIFEPAFLNFPPGDTDLDFKASRARL